MTGNPDITNNPCVRTKDSMSNSQDPIDNAIKLFPLSRTIRLGEQTAVIACLIRQGDWRPLDAPWWRKESACIIGADLDGNFFLRYCDGSVLYWNHKTQLETLVAPSVSEFVRLLTADIPSRDQLPKDN
jgi:hypothetical protein